MRVCLQVHSYILIKCEGIKMRTFYIFCVIYFGVTLNTNIAEYFFSFKSSELEKYIVAACAAIFLALCEIAWVSEI